MTDDSGCTGSLDASRGTYWICTAHGRRFWPLDPRPEEVDIVEIAHALANLCRFAGHCRSFYSVAQHSVLCQELAKCREWSLDVQKAALLHDAAEAYVVDLPRPLKLKLPDYVRIEERVQAVIREALHVPWDAEIAKQVKELDNIALATEKRDLMSKDSPPWGELPEPDIAVIQPQAPDVAGLIFRRRFYNLFS